MNISSSQKPIPGSMKPYRVPGPGLNKKIKDDLATLPKKKKGYQYEIEARIGHMNGKNFIPGVNKETFNIFLENFQPTTLTKTQTQTDKDIRLTISEDGEETWMTKRRIFDLTEGAVRTSLSLEQSIDEVKNFKASATRDKTRYQHQMDETTVLDMTIVVETIKNKSIEKYEIELEMVYTGSVPTKEEYEQFESNVNKVLNIFQYPLFYERVNTYLNGKTDNTKILNTFMSQARNLRINDLVWGGLGGNISTAYTVAHKADGLRRHILFDQDGIWLFYPPKTVSHLSPISIGPSAAILECEMIPVESRLEDSPDEEYWLLAYDCIMYNKTLLSSSYTERRSRMKEILDMYNALPLENLKIDMKDVHLLDEPFAPTVDRVRKIFTTLDKIVNETPNYKTDGLIFTPDNAPYNPHSEKYKLWERKLTDYPDICKWKPVEEITIDFAVMKKDGLKLLMGDGFGKAYHYDIFEGSRYNKFTGEVVIDKKTLKKLTLVDNLEEYNEQASIVEMSYQDGNLVFKGIRYDKNNPNQKDIALDNWDMIHNPITVETLTGKSSKLVSRYHNRIKETLHRETHGSYLLDLGSGQGGDVNKWSKYEKIVCVEPNKDYLDELKLRIALNNLEDKVVIVNAGAQDTKKITKAVKEHFDGRKADVISMMLSMSFLWQDFNILKSLSKTIKDNLSPEGEIIFLTIDGDAVQELFQPLTINEGSSKKGKPFQGDIVHEIKKGKLNLSPVSMAFKNSELQIDIADADMVKNQTEWLVHIDDLSLLLEDFPLLELHRADKELFLSDNMKLFSNLYTYGRFGPMKTKVKYHRGPYYIFTPSNIKTVKSLVKKGVSNVKIANLKVTKRPSGVVVTTGIIKYVGNDNTDVVKKLKRDLRTGLGQRSETITRKMLENANYDLKSDENKERNITVDFSRVVDFENDRTLPYRERKDKIIPVLHLGQRKLLLSEIEFLTLYGKKASTVVYAGAAPGHHINFLIQLFPEYTYHLYDPREINVKPGPKVFIYKQFFTDDDAKKYKGQKVLFISDIRTGEGLNEETDQEVMKNMEEQARWVKLMKPSMASLKFRLSWDEDEQDYLSGDIYFGIWAPKSSTETRLFTNGKEKETYDAKKYQDIMYRFNAVTRIQYFDNSIQNVPGADHCYDCTAEEYVLNKYLKKFKNSPYKDVSSAMNGITSYISQGLDIGAHGLCPDVKNITEREKCIHQELEKYV